MMKNGIGQQYRKNEKNFVWYFRGQFKWEREREVVLERLDIDGNSVLQWTLKR